MNIHDVITVISLAVNTQTQHTPLFKVQKFNGNTEHHKKMEAHDFVVEERGIQ